MVSDKKRVVQSTRFRLKLRQPWGPLTVDSSISAQRRQTTRTFQKQNSVGSCLLQLHSGEAQGTVAA